MDNFTPVSALLGGALIGLASVWLLATHGRIAGVSSILHGLVPPRDAAWRVAFLLGLLLAGVAWRAAGGPMPVRESLPDAWVLAAGLLVGFGTRLGGGCTSGHGVCGLSRLSARSLVAVMIFMATGIAAAVIARHVLGVPS